MSSGSSPPPADWHADDPFFVDLKRLVIEATGLAYYADKDEELSNRVRRRMKAAGVGSLARYLEMLRGNENGAGGGEGNDGPGTELDRLVSELTVGETHFFRHREQLDVFRETILPDVLERNRHRRRLRIWSAGCATGPEAYTVAIILGREFATSLSGWDVSIVGTDINRKFLARAREGSFEAWALRSTSEELRLSCFRKEGKSWILRPPYRERLSFQYHNLIEHSFPSLLNNLSAFDVIFCRNVLIYFDTGTIRKVVDRLHRSLVDGGWLVVGHAENRPELFRAFQRVSVSGTVVYQRDGRSAGTETVSRPPEKPASGLGAFGPPAPAVAKPPPIVREPAPSPPDPPSAEPPGPSPAVDLGPYESTDLAAARRFADRGQWEEALECCERLLERDRLDPFVHFYLSLVREQMGEKDSAAESLRKAIYLDRGFVLAHYHLGLIQQKEGDAGGARKSFENVLALLSRKRADEVLEEADELRVGELRELAEKQCEVLRGA